MEVLAVSIHEVPLRRRRVPEEYEQEVLRAVDADLLPLVVRLLEDGVDDSGKVHTVLASEEFAI